MTPIQRRDGTPSACAGSWNQSSGSIPCGAVEHYPDELRPEDYRERAAFRARTSPSGVGAAVERDDTDRDRGGRRWYVLVSEGQRFTHVPVEAPELGPYEAVVPEAVEAAVERRANRGGLAGLLGSVPVVLARADLAEQA